MEQPSPPVRKPNNPMVPARSIESSMTTLSRDLRRARLTDAEANQLPILRAIRKFTESTGLYWQPEEADLPLSSPPPPPPLRHSNSPQPFDDSMNDLILLHDPTGFSATPISTARHQPHKKTDTVPFAPLAATITSHPNEQQASPQGSSNHRSPHYSIMDRLDILLVTALVSTLLAATIAALLKAFCCRNRSRATQRRRRQELNRHSIQEVEERLLAHLQLMRRSEESARDRLNSH